MSGTAGRPKAQIDPSELERICALQATDEEIAANFRVTLKTIQRRKASKQLLEVKDEKTKQVVFTGTFAEIMERGKARGRISVRRGLFVIMNSGKHGAAAAAIFLAKNLLGYTDRQELTGKDGAPLVPEPRPFADVPTEKLMQAITLLSTPKPEEPA